MGKNPPKWLPGERVNETILLQRKSVEQLRADRVLRKPDLRDQRARRKMRIDSKRKAKMSTKKFISAQTILKHALRKGHQARTFAKIGERVDGKRRNKSAEEVAAAAAGARIALVVRAKGKLIPGEVMAGFRRLGLSKLYSARLVHVTPQSAKLIAQLKPFSIVGQPSTEQIEQLVRTRGSFWNAETESKRFISGNLLVEQTLGQYGILCVEDIAIAIASKSEHVDAVLAHIAPFDFHPPRQLYTEKHRSVHQKLEIVNPESFAAYLAQQLGKTAAVEKKVARRQRGLAATAAAVAVTAEEAPVDPKKAEVAPAKKPAAAGKKKKTATK